MIERWREKLIRETGHSSLPLVLLLTSNLKRTVNSGEQNEFAPGKITRWMSVYKVIRIYYINIVSLAT